MSAFIDQHRGRFGVEPICRTLDVSASAYYRRATGEPSARRIEDERLTERIRTVHKTNYECYGYRRVHAALLRQGETVGRDQVARLMRSGGLQGAKRRGKPWRTTMPDPGAQKRPDLVEAGLHRLGTGPPLGRRSHVSALLGRPRVLRVRDRRVLPPCRRLAARRRTCAPPGPRRACGWRSGPAAPAPRSQLVHHTDQGAQYTELRLHAGRSTTTTCSRRSGRSATRTTRRWFHSAPPGAGWVGTRSWRRLPWRTEAGVAGVGWFVEPFVLVVGLVGGEQSGAVPGLDGAGVHAERVGGLVDGEQAVGAEPVVVAGELVVAAEVQDDAGGERLVLAGAVTGGVELLGGLGVGVVVEEPVEHCEGVGVGLAGLPGGGRDRDREAGGLAAAEADVQVDAGRSCSG